MIKHISKFNHYRKFVFLKVSANLQAEASKYYLSYLWWILEPVMHMFVYFLVFGVLLQRGTENYVVFLLTGIISWLWFNRTVTNSMMSIIAGRPLIMQVHIPKIIFPTITACQDAVKQMVVMILFLLFIMIYGIRPSIFWFALPVLIGTQFLLNIGAGYLVAAVIPFMDDLRFLVTTGLHMMFFISGVIFQVETIPEKYHPYFFLNPMATLIFNYRKILLNNSWPDWQAIMNINITALVLIVVMIGIVRKLDHFYPRIVL